MWQGTADIRVADEVPDMVAQRPKIVDKNGKAKRIVISTPPDQALLDYMKELAERADNLKNVPAQKITCSRFPVMRVRPHWTCGWSKPMPR